MRHFVFAALFVLCLLVAFPRMSATAAELKLPESFSAQFSVFSRDSSTNSSQQPTYKGTVNYI
jgi:hypothetical protein